MEPDFRDPKFEPAFENVYPRYEFAPLIWLALAAAGWIKGRLAKRPRALRPASGAGQAVPRA